MVPFPRRGGNAGGTLQHRTAMISCPSAGSPRHCPGRS